MARCSLDLCGLGSAQWCVSAGRRLDQAGAQQAEGFNAYSGEERNTPDGCLCEHVLADRFYLAVFPRAEFDSGKRDLEKILCDGTILRPQLQWFLLRSSEEASMRWLSMLGACALILLCASILRERGVSLRLWLLSRPWWVQGTAVVVGVVVVLVFGVYGGNYDATQFVYFQF